MEKEYEVRISILGPPGVRSPKQQNQEPIRHQRRPIQNRSRSARSLPDLPAKNRPKQEEGSLLFRSPVGRQEISPSHRR